MLDSRISETGGIDRSACRDRGRVGSVTVILKRTDGTIESIHKILQPDKQTAIVRQIERDDPHYQRNTTAQELRGYTSVLEKGRLNIRREFHGANTRFKIVSRTRKTRAHNLHHTSVQSRQIANL